MFLPPTPSTTFSPICKIHSPEHFNFQQHNRQNLSSHSSSISIYNCTLYIKGPYLNFWLCLFSPNCNWTACILYITYDITIMLESDEFKLQIKLITFLPFLMLCCIQNLLYRHIQNLLYRHIKVQQPITFWFIFLSYQSNRGHAARWRSWLRHCATSRRVAGSIPDGIAGIFNWHNPSGCTMAWGWRSL
jgi:hypothetical protein